MLKFTQLTVSDWEKWHVCTGGGDSEPPCTSLKSSNYYIISFITNHVYVWLIDCANHISFLCSPV